MDNFSTDPAPELPETVNELQPNSPREPDNSGVKPVYLVVGGSIVGLSLVLIFIVYGYLMRQKISSAAQLLSKSALVVFQPAKDSNDLVAVGLPTPVPSPTPTKAPDSADTLAEPQKITSSDGKHYLLYGQPVGQNNKAIKKIIFSLPGHGSSAEADYAAWKVQLLANGGYALASINWWDGKGEAPQNYYTPEQVAQEIQYFLVHQNYQPADIVILEGFSRGSANTYPVVANDVASYAPVIDGVISASGKYQSDFAMSPELLNQNNGQVFANIPWILACGEKDPNPTRDGCDGMTETQAFLESKGAHVLGILKDPNGTHGAFHQSPLKLAEQALKIFDTYFK